MKATSPNNTKISAVKIQKISVLLRQLDIEDMKEELVMSYTDGRTKSRGEMMESEANELLDHLQGIAPGKTKEANYGKKDTMRKKIISKFREMNYNKDGKADMVAIQEKLVKYWKKKLNDYDFSELCMIISVLETKWIPNYYNQLKSNQ